MFKYDTGHRFGALVIKYRPRHPDDAGNYHSICICDCGRETTVRMSNLTTGMTKTCGSRPDHA